MSASLRVSTLFKRPSLGLLDDRGNILFTCWYPDIFVLMKYVIFFVNVNTLGS